MRLLILIIVCFSVYCSAELIITEIYPNPVMDEPENEWIEIYNSGESIDLKDLIIFKNGKNISIEGGFYNETGTILDRNSFALITNCKTRVYNNFNVSSSVLKLYACSSLKGLRNTKENFSLIVGEDIFYASYTSSKNGLSLIFDGSKYIVDSATPGFHENVIDSSCDYSISLDVVNESYKFVVIHESGENANVSVFQEVRSFFNESLISKNSVYQIVKRKTLSLNPSIDKNGIYFVEGFIDSSCDSDSSNDFVSYPLIVNEFEDCNISEKIVYVNQSVYEECEIDLNKNYHLNKVYESEGLVIRRGVIYIFIVVLILVIIGFVVG